LLVESKNKLSEKKSELLKLLSGLGNFRQTKENLLQKELTLEERKEITYIKEELKQLEIIKNEESDLAIEKEQLEIKKTALEKELEQLISSIKNKLGEELEFMLEILLETQTNIVKSENLSSEQKNLEKLKASLNKKIKEEEIHNLCQKQKEVAQLEEIVEFLGICQEDEPSNSKETIIRTKRSLSTSESSREVKSVKLDNSEVMEIDEENGSTRVVGGTSIKGGIDNVRFEKDCVKFFGKEYKVRGEIEGVIGIGGDSVVDGIYKGDIRVESSSGTEVKIKVWGIREILKKIKEDDRLVIIGNDRLEENIPFAVLVRRNKSTRVYYRIGLIELEENYEKKIGIKEEEEIIIGADNAQENLRQLEHQSQIPPK
jgi:hypothetical protein